MRALSAETHYQLKPTSFHTPSFKRPLSSVSRPSNQTVLSSSPSDQTLVSSAVSILTQHRSKSRWNRLKSLDQLLPHHTSQIILRLRNNPHLAHRFFLYTHSNSISKPSLISYSTIIHILARARFKSQAQNLIRSAIRLDNPSCESDLPGILKALVKTYRLCDSAPFVFDLFIMACLESNRADQALSTVRMLRSRSFYPLINTCNCLIRAISRRNGSRSGYSAYKEVFGVDELGKARVFPNVNTFNELMLSFYQDSVLDDVEDVWLEMGKSNCTPNIYSYSILLASYCDSGKMVEAERVWVEMGVMGMKHDIVVYNTIIGGFCLHVGVERAEEFFRDMGVCGIEPTCVTYEHLINGYCRIGDIDLAMLLYKCMCRKGFKPKVSVTNNLIGGLCDKGTTSKGLDFLRILMRHPDYVPTQRSYHILIDGFIKERRMEEGLKLQKEMVQKGFDTSQIIYDAFIDGYIREGNKELAQKLREEMLGTIFS